MSKTETSEVPDAVVVSPDTDAVHRQGDGFEPACIDRLHHVDDDTEWRLTHEQLTDPTARCGHPECFQDEQPVADGAVAVPAKYQPEPRQYEDKKYLQEQYWGQLKSVREIADENGVSPTTIKDRLRRHGIPSRVDGYTRENSVSPFTGFYRSAAARTDEVSRTRYDEDAEYSQHATTDADGSFEWGVVDSKGDRR